MKIRQVVYHAPGPNLQHGVDFREQPGVMEHVHHYAQMLEQGQLLMGGPFTDADSGGMMIAMESVNREELEAFAAKDPAVQKGLLTFQVKTWYVAMAEKTEPRK